MNDNENNLNHPNLYRIKSIQRQENEKVNQIGLILNLLFEKQFFSIVVRK